MPRASTERNISLDVSIEMAPMVYPDPKRHRFGEFESALQRILLQISSVFVPGNFRIPLVGEVSGAALGPYRPRALGSA